MAQTQARIGWIGLGKMGLPICRRLRAAGHPVTAYVRNQSGRDRAAAENIKGIDSLRGLAAEFEIVFSAISDDRALTEIVSGDGALAANMRSGQMFVDTSTVSPQASGAVAAQLDKIGVQYLRAPVSGSTMLAEAGQLTTMVSGPRDAFDALTALFQAFTSRQFYVGAGEEARYLKLVLNTMVGATSALVAEALTFGRKGGLDVAVMLDVICNSAVASPLIGYKSKMLVSENFDAAFTVKQMMKDLDIVLSVGKSDQSPVPLTTQIRRQFEAACLSGDGDKDFFVLFREYGRFAGQGA